MDRITRFSWHQVQWRQAGLYGTGIGAVFGLLVGSTAFRWGPASYAGKVFVALLGQPPLLGVLLVGVILLGGLLLGSRRPYTGWVEGVLFCGGVVIGGLLVGGLIRLAAGPSTPQGISEVYRSASHAFLRLWLMLGVQLLLWGGAGMATGMFFNGLRRGQLRRSVVGALIATLTFTAAILAQSPLFQFAFPGGI